jgi:hypothetical protein
MRGKFRYLLITMCCIALLWHLTAAAEEPSIRGWHERDFRRHGHVHTYPTGPEHFPEGRYYNVTLVWLGRGEYPAPLPEGIELTRDVDVWNRARLEWLNRHDIAIGTSYASGDEAVAHFGLGRNDRCDVEVRWGKLRRFRRQVAANQSVTVKLE